MGSSNIVSYLKDMFNQNKSNIAGADLKFKNCPLNSKYERIHINMLENEIDWYFSNPVF